MGTSACSSTVNRDGKVMPAKRVNATQLTTATTTQAPIHPARAAVRRAEAARVGGSSGSGSVVVGVTVLVIGFGAGGGTRTPMPCGTGT